MFTQQLRIQRSRIMLYTYLIILCQIWISVEDELFPELPMGISDTPSMLCNNHSDLLVQEFENLSLWAYEVRDATAKSSFGALRGNIYNFGQFDQCMSLEAPFPFQYCLVTVKAQIPRQNVTRDDIFSLYFQPQSSVLERMYDFGDEQQQTRNFVTLGWCIPESCSPVYLEEFLQKYMNEQDSVLSRNNVSYLIQVPSNLCQKQRRDQPFRVIDISFCVFSAILLLVTIIATIADSYKKFFGEKINMNVIVQAFSMKRNFKELIKSHQCNSESRIFFGLKTIGIILIIGGHKMLFHFAFNVIMNLDYIEKQYRITINMILARTDLIVDMFFFMSGWLAICSILKLIKKKSVNPLKLVMLRYVRLTPAYAFVIFYYTTVMSYTGSGPIWPLMAVEKNDCEENWWTNLIYLGNYINTDHQCAPHTWYLNCDFHYFIAAVGICYIIKRKTKLGLILLVILLVVSVMTVFILTAIYHATGVIRLTPTMARQLKTHDDFNFLYIKTHGRASTYFIGMLAGYFCTKTFNNNISKVKSWILLFASMLLLLAPVYSSILYLDPHYKYNNIEAGAFAALHRGIWILGFAGLIYLIFCGQCQMLYKILSWPPFIILGKLSYAAYLIHFQIVYRSILIQRSPGSIIGIVQLLTYALCDVPLVFFSALVIYLCIEAPCKNILQHTFVPKLPPTILNGEINKTDIILEDPKCN